MKPKFNRQPRRFNETVSKMVRFSISEIRLKNIQIKKEQQNIRLTWAAIIPFLIVLPVFVFSKMVCTMMIQELLSIFLMLNKYLN